MTASDWSAPALDRSAAAIDRLATRRRPVDVPATTGRPLSVTGRSGPATDPSVRYGWLKLDWE